MSGGDETRAASSPKRVEGSAEEAFASGFNQLQGRGIARDLASARKHFIRAADLGHPRANRIAIALLANGTTGGRDWSAALDRLEGLSSAGDELAARQLRLLDAMKLDEEGNSRRIEPGERLSERPQVLLLRNLFSKQECQYLIEMAAPAYRAATVGHVAGGAGRQVIEQIRTCDAAAFPWIAEDPVIHALNRRIAVAADVPVQCGEPLQILRYRPGQEFKPHRDCTEMSGNQRILTMLVYLNEAYTGGETQFLENGLKIRGNTGDGLLFRNADENGAPDPHSLHAGLPVQSGEKIVASRWIRQKRFGPAA